VNEQLGGKLAVSQDYHRYTSDSQLTEGKSVQCRLCD